MGRPIEAIVAAALKSVPALANRVYPMVAPQGTVSPFAVYTVVTDTEAENLDGDAGVVDVYLQVDIYSPVLSECKKAAKACRKALREAPGVACATEASRNGYEDDTKFYRNSSDYRILVESED